MTGLSGWTLLALAALVGLGAASKCYRCDEDNGNCLTGYCEGRFCFKRSAMLNGRTRTSKVPLSRPEFPIRITLVDQTYLSWSAA